MRWVQPNLISHHRGDRSKSGHEQQMQAEDAGVENAQPSTPQCLTESLTIGNVRPTCVAELRCGGQPEQNDHEAQATHDSRHFKHPRESAPGREYGPEYQRQCKGHANTRANKG